MICSVSGLNLKGNEKSVDIWKEVWLPFIACCHPNLDTQFVLDPGVQAHTV